MEKTRRKSQFVVKDGGGGNIGGLVLWGGAALALALSTAVFALRKRRRGGDPKKDGDGQRCRRQLLQEENPSKIINGGIGDDLSKEGISSSDDCNPIAEFPLPVSDATSLYEAEKDDSAEESMVVAEKITTGETSIDDSQQQINEEIAYSMDSVAADEIATEEEEKVVDVEEDLSQRNEIAREEDEEEAVVAEDLPLVERSEIAREEEVVDVQEDLALMETNKLVKEEDELLFVVDAKEDMKLMEEIEEEIEDDGGGGQESSSSESNNEAIWPADVAEEEARRTIKNVECFDSSKNSTINTRQMESKVLVVDRMLHPIKWRIWVWSVAGIVLLVLYLLAQRSTLAYNPLYRQSFFIPLASEN